MLVSVSFQTHVKLVLMT